ncbi:MAG: biotin transporter BioY [Chloroflexota bacterium]|nr:biotin transporter BioY [Chloroflexota bacterium]
MQTGPRVGVLAKPTLAWAALTCTLFALMVGVFARIAIPLPFTPVPFTLQPMAVILTGLLLGSRLGFAAMLEYFVLGALGAPVFQGGTAGLAGAAFVTGSLGYLISYPFAAYVVGRLSENSTRGLPRLSLAGLAGVAVIYVFGVAYLAGWLNVVKHLTGVSMIGQAWLLGAAPFVLPDAVKAIIAGAVARKKLFD